MQPVTGKDEVLQRLGAADGGSGRQIWAWRPGEEPPRPAKEGTILVVLVKSMPTRVTPGKKHAFVGDFDVLLNQPRIHVIVDVTTELLVAIVVPPNTAGLSKPGIPAAGECLRQRCSRAAGTADHHEALHGRGR